MPLITFEAGELPEDVKKELMEKLTRVSAEVTGIPESSFWVFIREMPGENIMVGGKTLKEIRKELEGD